jgi:hypothetical protein
MRSNPILAATLVTALGACSVARSSARVREPQPVYTSATSTDIFGDWILGAPDRTAFVGARVVQLSLSPSRFRIIAQYPTGDPWVIAGAVQVSRDGGAIRLVPETNTHAVGGEATRVPLRPGQPVELLASAADNTMVFAPTEEELLAQPSSVWHRRAAAVAAGLVTSVSAGEVASDSAKKKP